MDKNNQDRRVIHKEILFEAIRCLNKSDYEIRSKGLVKLRDQSSDSELARIKLRDLIYDSDGCMRILAAEALSITRSHSYDAIPVLEATLEIGREMNISPVLEPWLRICLGALYRYGKAAITAENIVWQYLYAQANQNLKLYATRLLSRLAKFSDASWAILCLLCQHEDSEIRTYARQIVSSEEFEIYCKAS